jgi:hypothetical protein
MPEQRDDRGRFAPGNAGGPGRPRRVVEGDYLRGLSDAVPPEKWPQIVATAVDQAVAGDPKAREWLGAYLVGKPTGDGLTMLADAEARTGAGKGVESNIDKCHNQPLL